MFKRFAKWLAEQAGLTVYEQGLEWRQIDHPFQIRNTWYCIRIWAQVHLHSQVLPGVVFVTEPPVEDWDGGAQ